MRLYCVVLLLASPSLASRIGSASHRPSHSYPHSGGHSGTGSGGGSYYPPSTGLSGNSNGYNSRNYNHQHYSSQNNYSPKTEVHHHYHYSPPKQISYGSTYHPVYQGSPPVYVYEYRDSGSRFDNLLTGLALYNLGRMSANRHDNHNYDSHREYSGSPGEICKLGISKQSGEYEETRIDCKLMSSFIFEANVSPGDQDVSSKTVSRTVTNTTRSVDNSSVTTVTVTNVTVTDALTSKGPSIKVTPGMTCYMIRLSSYSTLKKNVECGLLQEYARSSMRRSSSDNFKPVMTTIIILILCIFLSFEIYN